MATIKTSLQLYDGMSSVFKSINNAMSITINSFEALQSASHKTIDTASISAARQELAQSAVVVNQMEEKFKKAGQAQNKFGNGTGALISKVKTLAASLGLAFSAAKIIELSDAMTSTTARLNLMNDGLQTTGQLQEKIFQSAQASRSSYLDSAAAVSKLGILAKDAFSSNDEMIAFVEQMNKQFKIGGASVMEQTSAMYQLTQAMAAGKLQGDEFRSIMENAPLLAQAISEEMGLPMGKLKEMSSQGLITAEVIKNAMFATADETNAKFAELPMTYGQVWTVIKNTMLQSFEPMIQAIGRGAQWIYDNWSVLQPLFTGLAAALAIFTGAMLYHTAVTWLAVAANKEFMMGLLTNPLGWIVIILAVIISYIYKWIQSVGGLKVAWHTVLTGIMNFFGDFKADFLSSLQDTVNSAIDILNAFINKLNTIPGVNFDLIEKVTFGTEANLKNEAAKKARNADLAKMKADALAAQGSDQLDFSDLYANAEATATNTGKMADSMEGSEEDLKYLRDLAEQEVINRFTTAEIKIDMTNNNTIGSDMDLDGIVSHLETKLYESMQVAAEGV